MAADPYKYFRVEGRELLEQLGQGVLDLEKGSASGDAIGRLLRIAHTLKGAARVVRQPEIAEQAHALEDVFALVREAAAPAPRAQINILLNVLDEIGRRLAVIPSPPGDLPQSARAPAVEPLHVFRPEMSDIDTLLDGVVEAHVEVAALRPMLQGAERARHLLDLVADQLAPSRASGAMVATGVDPGAKVQSMVVELRAMFTGLEQGIASGIDRVDRELGQLREAAERLRLIPASATFNFLERAVRDVAHATGKQVTFEGRGGSVRVDTSVLGVIQAALLQVVRNAVAHGIEGSERERQVAGKPTAGRVTLEVFHRGTSVSFVCIDDGGGIDFGAVRRILEQKGLSRAASLELNDDLLLRQLLNGGISTSDTVTGVAGRGIGLDVVREAAAQLGGDVTIRTERGRSTTVELVVPLSIGACQALLVESAPITAAVPMDAVRSTFRLGSRDVIVTAQGDSVLHDGSLIPLVSLHRVMGATPSPARTNRATSAFVVQTDRGSAAFSVDRILGTANVVTRPLPVLAPAASVVVGASLDAAGNPRLVLDPDNLVLEAQRSVPGEGEVVASRPVILVVDDSLTTRMLEQSILESAGYEVELASSGEEALTKASHTGYGLFLVDVEMPGMDGFSFIERVRADPGLCGIPSILVTSRSSPADRQRGREVGAQAYIVKSDFDQGFLLERVKALTG